MTTALITGAAGQDGTLLAAYLSRAGHTIVGVVKPGTDTERFSRYVPSATVIQQDLEDIDDLRSVVIEAEPHLLANLAGVSSITESQHFPELTQRINVDAVAAIVDGLTTVSRRTAIRPRMFQATSAAIFEGVDHIPQNECTEASPRTPYAMSKYAALQMIDKARTEVGLFAVSGILYNHESPLRGPEFVTRKISMAAARIAAGQQDTLELGNIEVARDWGWAPDYVRAMILMLRAETPKDYVIATGVSHRLSYFLKKAFAAAGITDWQAHVVSTEANQRAVDTNLLVGESLAIKNELGWRPTVDFDSIARIMVEQDRALLKDPAHLWDLDYVEPLTTAGR
jgi:GDPmannose 4,6-dehydratase